MTIIQLQPTLRTRKQMSSVFHVSQTTLWRRMKSGGLPCTRQLLRPSEQEKIAALFDLQIVWLQVERQ